MSDLTLTIELSEDMKMVLANLCGFYGKDEAQVIEVALEQLATDVMLITETNKAIKKGRDK